MFKVLWDKQSIEDLKKIDYLEAKAIIKKVYSHLANNPKNLGKQLSAKYKGLYRYLYPNCKIIYELFEIEKEIIITLIKIEDKNFVYHNR